MKALLAAGANADALAQGGLTPLGLAAQQGHAEVVGELLKHVSDPDPRMADGVTPLISAADIGATEVLRQLIAAGADVNTFANMRYTALMAAVRRNRLDSVRLLLEKGADVNAKGEVGLIIPLTAIKEPSPEHDADAKKIIDAGPENVDCALRLAQALGHDEVAALLIRFGAVET